MKINDLKHLNLPKRNDEKFRKIDFKALFSNEFKAVKKYELNIANLESKKDSNLYDNVLFNIVKEYDENELVLIIKEDTKEPILIKHHINEEETIFTNNLKIQVKKGVKAQVIEVFTNTTSNSTYLVNRNFNLEENSNLEYVKVQDFDENTSFIYNTNFSLEDFSTCDFTNFEFGKAFVVNSFENNIENKNIQYNLNGLVKLNKTSNINNLITTIHNNESSASDINYKHTLKDSSRAVFKATSIVNEKALFTKAFQNSNTILLSDDAAIYAQPHLEISIDELEASHGATTGTLNKEQLLYLQSRGIHKELAYDILLEAFESQIYDNIKNELLKEFMKNYSKDNYV